MHNNKTLIVRTFLISKKQDEFIYEFHINNKISKSGIMRSLIEEMIKDNNLRNRILNKQKNINKEELKQRRK